MVALLALLAVQAPHWETLAPGVDYAAVGWEPKPALGDGTLHVVRLDPSVVKLRTLLGSQIKGSGRVARQWCDDFKLVVAINAGMFAAARYERDHSTHVGFLRNGDHLNSARWLPNYQSILLIGARKPGLPSFTMRDAPSKIIATDYDDYDTVIQNLRLISDPAVNVWKENHRQWSEAAIALDRDGRLLFLFSRSPFSMVAFNNAVLALPLGIVRAAHVEGGPEASLSVHSNSVRLDLAGSYETGFNENDNNHEQWPIPNVLGVESR